MEDFLTVSQAAEKTGIGKRQLRRIVSNNKEELKAEKHGRDWYIPSNSIGFIPVRKRGQHGPWREQK